MLTNLIFCLNATIPVFIMLLLGAAFMHFGIFDDTFVKKLNQFVFKIALPVLVFYDLAKEDFYQVWDTKYVLFCFGATAISILLTMAISLLLKDKSLQGEFIQVAYRSSAAILGITLVQNIYGHSGMTPLMIIGSVPLYNIMAVIVLAWFKPNREKLSKPLLVNTGKNILTNPIILGILVGLVWSMLQIPMAPVLDKSIESVARLASPLGLMAMGASLNYKKAATSIGAAGTATLIKLIGLGLIFVPLAIALGFRQEKLVAALIMCCSPTTVSCYIMAKNMGHDGTLTSSTVVLTTLLSAFTLTGWLFGLKSLGYL
ncbi:putative permease [Clostridiales Family XIII bacterium PM5-7]